jgi:hypothetical protein
MRFFPFGDDTNTSLPFNVAHGSGTDHVFSVGYNLTAGSQRESTKDAAIGFIIEPRWPASMGGPSEAGQPEVHLHYSKLDGTGTRPFSFTVDNAAPDTSAKWLFHANEFSFFPGLSSTSPSMSLLSDGTLRLYDTTLLMYSSGGYGASMGAGVMSVWGDSSGNGPYLRFFGNGADSGRRDWIAGHISDYDAPGHFAFRVGNAAGAYPYSADGIKALDLSATAAVLGGSLTLKSTPMAPTPAALGANNGALWVSNKFLYYSYTADGSTSNDAVKIAP